MKSKPINLYKNHINSIGIWSIWFEDNIIHIEHATNIDGQRIHHTELVPEGKQSRSLHEQVISRIKSRINKQLDKGYVKTYSEALVAPTNAMNLIQPMLAQPIKRVSTKPKTVFIQPKLDGHRCLITKHNGELKAYSRQGKPIDTISHILDNIDIPDGTTLDGELYLHGEKLQTIASWAKRLQDMTKKLEYHVYDTVMDEPYGDRYHYLSNYQLGESIKLVDTECKLNLSEVDIGSKLRSALSEGYEGLIIRDDVKGYEAGRRSTSLIKVKQMFDAEYLVVNITPSSTGWGVLTCLTPEGRTFGVSAPGTHEEKREALINRDVYIGKHVTVEYSQLTKDDIPFHPVATQWREDI